MQVFSVTDLSAAALRALNYSPAVEKIRRTPKKKCLLLGRLVREFGPAYGTVFTRKDCSPEHGVELLSQTDMFAAEPSGRVIRMDSMARPERHEVKRGQVLIAGAGTLGPYELFGRSLIADARLEGKYVGPDSMTLVFSEPDSDQSLFTYAFLATSTGVAAVRSTSYGTKILRFREDLLRNLAVPLADDATLKRVADLIRTTVQQRETYLTELRAARKLLEDLPEMQEALAMCGERKTRSIAWSGPLPSLCAWNFASIGAARINLEKSWSRALADVLAAPGLFRGDRLPRIPCHSDRGFDLYSQRDAWAIRPVPRRVTGPRLESLAVEQSHLLVASKGQLTEGTLFGKIERASHLPDGALVTEDVTRVPLREEAEVIFAFLSTRVGQALLRSAAVGTSIPQLRRDLIERLPIPAIAAKTASQIALHVGRASAGRQAATSAENEAIRIVEQEVLPSWLG